MQASASQHTPNLTLNQFGLERGNSNSACP